MGGLGSGRREYATTPTVGQCRTLSIGSIHEFTESPGIEGSVWWGATDQAEADVLIHVSSEGDSGTADGRPGRLRLRYHTKAVESGEIVDEYDYRVPLDYTECHFGGFRPWFRCPDCKERIEKLHMPPGSYRFACRECYNLGYHTSRTSGDEVKQAELRFKRAFEKADKDNRRPHPGGLTGIPKRPKGMHYDTFEKLQADVWATLDDWGVAIERESRRLVERIEKQRD